MKELGTCERCGEYTEVVPPYSTDYIEANKQPRWCINCVEAVAEAQWEDNHAAGGNDHCRQSMIEARKLK